MNELSNIANAVGTYKNILTTIISNRCNVQLVNKLTISKYANKVNWKSGYLTYTIFIDNNGSEAFEGLVVKDNISNKVEMVDNTLKINGVISDKSQFEFDTKSRNLIVKLGDIDPNSRIILNFSVKKRYDDYFILENYCTLFYNVDSEIKSNNVMVTSTVKKFSRKDYGCDVPYWKN